MASDVNHFLSKTLGEDFMESLTKFELWKPGTKTTIDHEEIKTALMIVPRTIMAILIRELAPMQIGDMKEFGLQIEKAATALVKVTKHERDVFSGEILENNKIVVDFKYRSIPGVGLVIMSAFELYDNEKLVEHNKHAPSEDITQKVQHLIEERLALHDLVGKVVDRKIEQRDAIQQLILAKINQDHKEKWEETSKKSEGIANITKIQSEDPVSKKDEYFRGMANGLQVANSIANGVEPKFIDPASSKKISPLKDFLDKKKNKTKPIEYSIEMNKGEKVQCPDCGKNIFDGKAFSACICYGDSGKIYIKKTEEGIKIRFGKQWDVENMQMLLEVLRKTKNV